jgi:uncharacterized protein YjeT (DUF2065 family)
MIEDILLLVIGLTLILVGLQAFLTPYRRRFANEMIKAATLMIMGFFVLYYWQTNVTLPVGGVGSNKYY